MSASPKVDVRVTRRFDATPDHLFDAWLDPDRARHFLFATPTGEMVRAEIDPRVGGAFTFVDRRDGDDVVHTGEYLEIDPPFRLVFAFMVPQYSPETTRVAIEILRHGTGSELTLTHEGVDGEMAERTKGGWGKVLGALATTLD
jgi:uncharacterized protein YndB with AHSA1/START domain